MRQIEVLRYLARERRWCSYHELTEAMGCSYRTVYRDIEQLRAIGCPIEHDDGPEGGWRLRRARLVAWIVGG